MFFLVKTRMPLLLHCIQPMLYRHVYYWVSCEVCELVKCLLLSRSHLLIDTIVMITDYKNCSRSRLQEQFINAKCFTNIMSSMAMITEASSNEV